MSNTISTYVKILKEVFNAVTTSYKPNEVLNEQKLFFSFISIRLN